MLYCSREAFKDIKYPLEYYSGRTVVTTYSEVYSGLHGFFRVQSYNP